MASRQLVRQLCVALKFSLVDQTKMITAASELSRNTVVYGGGGVYHALVGTLEQVGIAALIGVPSSSCWVSLTGLPVSSARTGSPIGVS